MAPVALLGYVALIMVIQGLERHAWWQNLCFLGSPARFWGLIYGKLAYFFKIRRFGPFWPYFGHFLANFWLIFDPPCKPSGQMLAAIFGTLNCPTHGSIIFHRSQICGRMREKVASFCLKRPKIAKLQGWKLAIYTYFYVPKITLHRFCGWFCIYARPQWSLIGFKPYRIKSCYSPKKLGPNCKNTHFC